MLKELEIKNIALITHLNVNFSKGLNIFSGETGAGKSIIIDSISFVLGKRADKSLIRYGEDQASVVAVFDFKNSQKTLDILSNLDIDAEEDDLIIKRTMTVDGKNTCSINGSRVSLSVLRDITSSLVDIYGQHDSTSMLDNSNHLEILDNYAKNELLNVKEKQIKLYNEYSDIKNKLKKYGSINQVNKNLDLLKYQLDEISNADLQENEEDELISKRNMMNNAEKLVSALGESYNLLYGDENGNSIERISYAINSLNHVNDDLPDLTNLIERLESSMIELKDVSESIRDLSDNCQFDQFEYNRIEDRLQLIRSLKRKYGNSLDEILQYKEKIQQEYDFYCDGENQIALLEEDLSIISKELIKNSRELSELRQIAANKLGDALITELSELGMKSCSFKTQFQNYSDEQILNIVNSNGYDSPIFLFSANAGQPVRELSKIISGGELSRFMLAVKNTISDLDGINCMIFDEIDSGISGNTASIVATKLYKISCHKQVLAITHLPQLASMADNHYLIEKYINNGETNTRLTLLSDDSLLNEIARLIGGNSQSNLAFAHAQELKDYSDNLKKDLTNKN